MQRLDASADDAVLIPPANRDYFHSQRSRHQRAIEHLLSLRARWAATLISLDRCGSQVRGGVCRTKRTSTENNGHRGSACTSERGRPVVTL
jgi:hypothetical protein